MNWRLTFTGGIPVSPTPLIGKHWPRDLPQFVPLSNRPEPDAPADARPAPTRPAEPTVRHGAGGTAVTGTDKTDQALRDALKAGGFKWSHRENLWYLPSTLPEHTRALRIDRLRANMAEHGRDLPVTDNPHRSRSNTHPQPHTSVETRWGDNETDWARENTTPSHDL